MSQNYVFNEALALDTFELGGGRVTTSGVYFGTIVSANTKKSSSGAEFFNVDFKTDDGKDAKFLSLCTVKKNGEPAFGINIAMSIFGCLKMREVLADANGFHPALAGKRIGFGLQVNVGGGKEKPNGGNYDSISIVRAFMHDTKQTYSEFKYGKTAEEYKSVIEDIHASAPVSAVKPSPQNSAAPSSSEADDLPF